MIISTKALAALLLGTICMGWGGCVSYDSSPPPQWPPAHVQLDPEAVYITGVSEKYMGPGREEALSNALETGRKMGLKNFVLSEVCQDLKYLDHRGIQMIRILYKAVPQPGPDGISPTSPSGTEIKRRIILPGQNPLPPGTVSP